MAARLEAPRAGARPGTATATARRAGLARPRLPATAELATIGAGYLGYAPVCLAIHADRHAAFVHAAQLWQAQRRMHLRIEPRLNRLAAARPALAEAARVELAARGMTGEIAQKGDKAPIQAGQRWPSGLTPGTTTSTGCSLRLAGAGRPDPTMAPTAWKMALSRSPLPRGSVEST